MNENTMNWQNQSDAIINNVELKRVISFQLGIDNFTKEDLTSIKEITLDSENIAGGYNPVYYNEIELFPNLKSITLRNLSITSNNMEKLQSIPEIQFEKCELDGIEKLHHVKKLSITNCSINNIEEMKQLTELEELSFINMSLEHLEIINQFHNLKKLTIINVPQFAISKIDISLPIEYLSIDTITNPDCDTIQQMKELKTISVSQKNVKDIKEELEYLENRGIKILVNDIYEY